MKRYFILLIVFKTINLVSQDYSYVGKEINYSADYKKIKLFKNIDKALKAPESIEYLKLEIDKDGSNFNMFVNNQSKFLNLKKLIIDNRWYQIELRAVLNISNFKKLEFLQVYSLPNLNFDSIYIVENLRYLEILASNLTELPNSIIKLKQLEFLGLTLNRLSFIPNSISELEKLKEIDLTNNCFQEIPVALSKVKQLKYLDFNNAEFYKEDTGGFGFCKNKIKSYPSILSEFKALKRISFYKVNIDDDLKNQMKSEFNKVKISF